MEKIRFNKYQEEVTINVNGVPTRVTVDKYKRVQLIKRGKNGRFESYMTQSQRLSLLLGILFTEVVIFLAII